MGWDVRLKRRLAVPLALTKHKSRRDGGNIKTRILKDEEDLGDLDTLIKLSENRDRLDHLISDIESDPEFVDTDEARNELDYVNASIQLGLLEVTAELEEIPSSDDLFEEAAA
jgi:hypothetical protein